MSFFKRITRGREYMNLWPNDKVLGAIFPEIRVKATLKLGSLLWPPFIVFMLVWTFIQGGGLKGIDFIYTLKNNYAVTICCVLFILLIPIQGYLWFYKRSKTLLNERQKGIYIKICAKLNKQAVNEPTMYDFVVILKSALKTKNNKDFLNML